MATRADHGKAFVCGVMIKRRRGPLALGGWSWPFGRLAIGESCVVAWGIGLRRFAVRVPFSELQTVRARPRRRTGTLRFERQGAGDLVVTAFRDQYEGIVDSLETRRITPTTD